MVVENKLDQTFGPFGSSTGFFLFIGGLMITFFSLFGIVLALIGAFAAFTTTKTIIDTENKRIKHADYLFGVYPVGKWIDVRPDMHLELKTVKRGYVGYISGTQPFDIRARDIRIFLCDSNNKQVIPIKKFRSLESAKNDLLTIRSLLGLTDGINRIIV